MTDKKPKHEPDDQQRRLLWQLPELAAIAFLSRVVKAGFSAVARVIKGRR